MVAVLGQAHSLSTYVSAALKAHLAMQHLKNLLMQFLGKLVGCVAQLVAQASRWRKGRGVTVTFLGTKEEALQIGGLKEAVRLPEACIAALVAFIIMLLMLLLRAVRWTPFLIPSMVLMTSSSLHTFHVIEGNICTQAHDLNGSLVHVHVCVNKLSSSPDSQGYFRLAINTP
jgi:hypothetical protein